MVTTADHQDLDGERYSQGYTGDAQHVTSPPLTSYTTTNRLLIPVANLSPHRTTVYDEDLGAAMVYEGDGTTNVAEDWRYEQQVSGKGSAKVVSGTYETAYEGTLTMDGTAKVVAVGTGCRGVRVTNTGATTEAIRVAQGVDSTDAGDNLTIVAAAATTGTYITALADGSSASVREIIFDPSTTHFSIANAVASATQVVIYEQFA